MPRVSLIRRCAGSSSPDANSASSETGQRRAAASIAAIILLASPVAASAATGPVDPLPAGTVVHLTLSPLMVPPGAPVVLTATTSPPLTGQVLDFQTQTSTGWSTLAARTLNNQGDASYAFRAGRLGGVGYRAAVVIAGAVASTSNSVQLAVVRSGPGDPNAYTYSRSFGGNPVRWSPCAAISYQVNTSRAYPGALADVQEAIRRIAQITGYRFHYNGSTAAMPVSYQNGEFVYHPSYPAHVDLLIGWAPISTGGEAGVGGWATTAPVNPKDQTRQHPVRAFAIYNSNDDSQFTPGFGSGAPWGHVILHELGHAMNLGHVLSPYQMMRPVITSDYAAIYGAGDTQGLFRLAHRAGCD